MEEEYGIRLTEDETKELKKMCNLSEGVYNDGVYDRAKEDLKNLIQSTGWSLAKAMEMLHIPPEEKEHYEQEMKKGNFNHDRRIYFALSYDRRDYESDY